MKSALFAVVAAATLTGAAWAQPVTAPPATVSTPVPASSSDITVPAGTIVTVATTDTLNTLTAKTGDKVGLTLVTPLTRDGVVVLPAGIRGFGVITHANAKASGGRPGEIHVAARYLEVDGVQIPLTGLQLSAKGRDLSKASLWALGTVKGSEAAMPAGTEGGASLAEDLLLVSGRLRSVAAISVPATSATAVAGADIVPGKVTAPAPGKGVIVFYRESTFVAGAYPLDIRTGEGFATRLATLYDGQYLTLEVDPGSYLYSSRRNGSDPLTIEIAAGQAYFVKGVALGLGAVPPTIITTSSQENFTKISAALRPVKLKK